MVIRKSAENDSWPADQQQQYGVWAGADVGPFIDTPSAT